MQRGGALGEMALATVTLAIDGAMRIALGACVLVLRRFCKAGAATFAGLQAISATRLRQEDVLC